MNADERTCPECAETVKAAAKVCKHCGHKLEPVKSAAEIEEDAKAVEGGNAGCALIAIIIIAFFAFLTSGTDEDAALIADGNAEDRATTDAPLDRSAQGLVVVKSRDGVRARLRDPDSAEFRNVGYYSGGKEGKAVCGEVNAKNAFGGFSGYERFVAMGEKVAFLESEIEASEFAIVWKGLCVKAGSDAPNIP